MDFLKQVFLIQNLNFEYSSENKMQKRSIRILGVSGSVRDMMKLLTRIVCGDCRGSFDKMANCHSTDVLKNSLA